MRSIQSTLFGLLIASPAAYADLTLNLTQGVSPISHDVYELHMTIFWICVVIGVVVFGAMFYAMFHHRKSKGAVPAEFHSHPVLEITWTLVPFLILVVMAIPASKVLINMNNLDKEDLTIKITGYQWKWQYEYLEDGISFFSNLTTPFDQIQNKAAKSANYLREVDHPLVVPIHKKIRFLVTSNDVNHAWWVPDLAVKRDAIPGFINEGWSIIDKPGTYVGQCAELCGVNHAFMPIVVVATTEEGYKNWVAEQKGGSKSAEADMKKLWTLEALMANGEKVYSRICAVCHQPGGVGMPPTFPPLKGSKIATGPIQDHINIVMNGKTGTAMQAFKTQLNSVDLASIITYERNAFGNNTGTSVQPLQINAIMQGTTMTDALKLQPESAAETGSTPAASAPAAPTTPAPPAAPTTPAPTATPSTTPVTPGAPSTSPSAAATGANPLLVTSASASVNAEELKTIMTFGEKIYMTTCVACHQPTGVGMPPTFPALKGSKIATGPLKDHLQIVLFGKPATAMQAFKDQLTDRDLAAVITYERNAWGNNTGTLVRPEDVQAARTQGPNNQ